MRLAPFEPKLLRELLNHLLTLTVNFLSNHRAGTSISFAATSASNAAFSSYEDRCELPRSIFYERQLLIFQRLLLQLNQRFLRIQHQSQEVFVFNKGDFKIELLYPPSFRLVIFGKVTSITFSSPFFMP